jgi:branched-chain amino acid transport system permease protein
MNLGGHDTAVAIAVAIDVLMALSFYLPMATGALFIVPIGSMGVGAYAAGELAIHGYPLALILCGGAIAGSVVALVGGVVVVRMAAWSAAIASVAIVEVLQVVMENFTPTGAAGGLLGIPLFTPSFLTYLLTGIVVLLLLAVEQTRIGDVMDAIRGNQLAAECSGIRMARVRMATFVTSGAIAGLAGAISAGFLGFVDPSTYGFSQLNNYLLAAILGGITTALGSLFGGITVNVVPQALSFASNYTLIAFAVIVIVVIIVRPQGLITRRMIRRFLLFVGRMVGLRSGATRNSRKSGTLPRYLSKRPAYQQLRAVGISKSFGGLNVVSGVELEIAAGSILGVIGANGAGKTTLVNLLTAVVPADWGELIATCPDSERHIGRIKLRTALELGIARTFQNGRLFPGLTTLEHVSLIRGVDGRALLELVGLADRADEIAMSLPYGDQRLVEIARALATQPRFLILDEPAAGMTNQEAAKVAELARRLSTEGLGVMIIDHNVEFISGVSDRMMAMDFGEVVATGTPAEVLRNPNVEEAYLGKPAHETSKSMSTSGMVERVAKGAWATIVEVDAPPSDRSQEPAVPSSQTDHRS